MMSGGGIVVQIKTNSVFFALAGEEYDIYCVLVTPLSLFAQTRTTYEAEISMEIKKEKKRKSLLYCKK